jgi:anti-anti-sigma factor
VDTRLEIARHTDGEGLSVLIVRGEVNPTTAPYLREALMEQLDRCGRLVVDLSGAVLFDASGLRVLLAARRESDRRGKPEPVLRGVRPLLAKSLRATGIDHLFAREPAPVAVLGRRTIARPLVVA